MGQTRIICPTACNKFTFKAEVKRLNAVIMCVLTAGQFRSIPLGNVYAEDADDWDLPDKTFSFVRTDTDGLFR